jgi:hypothetical protein
MDHVHD